MITIKNRFLLNRTANYFQPAKIFCAGEVYFNKYQEKFGRDKVIKIPSMDYNEFILSKKSIKKIKNKKKYAVLIDVHYNHSDGTNSQERFPPEIPCSYKNYYGPINFFFEKFISHRN